MSNTEIARLRVERGALTEYPIAQRIKGGWQNGVTFYPDSTVAAVLVRYAPTASSIEGAE